MQEITVITPAHNAAATLPRLYASLRAQDYGAWRWIIVDDSSTDATPTLLAEWAESDKRLRTLTRRVSSGCPKTPRDEGIAAAGTELMVCLDADDDIAPRYLSTMARRQEATEADIVYPTHHFMRGNETAHVLPKPEFDTSQTYAGRDLVTYTLDGWRIGTNGALYRRRLLLEMIESERDEPVWATSDELCERLLLIAAGRVAFAADATYYYNIGDTLSVTRRFSPRRFHCLYTDRRLIAIIEREYGSGSPELRAAHCQLWHTWRGCAALLATRWRELTEGHAEFLALLHASLRAIDRRQLPTSSRLRLRALPTFTALFAAVCLRHAPSLLAELATMRLAPQWWSERFLGPRSEQAMLREIVPTYTDTREAMVGERPVVAIFRGTVSGGGLVDRLRGTVSVFQACREEGREFRLLFTHPFPLADYLEPATYDWRVSETQLRFSQAATQIVVVDTMTDTRREHRRQLARLRHAISSARGRETHVYTNAACAYDADFATLFNTLFRPTPRLETKLNEVTKFLGQGYISVSARFLNLLDDFNEQNWCDPLPPRDGQQLLAAAIAALRSLHGQHPGSRVLVCSDSRTFAEAAAREPFVSVIPGTVTHIDNDTPRGYTYYEKTFLDFFAISRASCSYIILGPGMHRSGFPYAAARIAGREVKTIAISK